MRTKRKCKKEEVEEQQQQLYRHPASKRAHQENPGTEWCVFSTYRGAAVGLRWFPERERARLRGFPEFCNSSRMGVSMTATGIFCNDSRLGFERIVPNVDNMSSDVQYT